MSRAVVVFCFVLFVGYVAGNLVKNDDVTTKDVKINDDDMNSVPGVDIKEPAAPIIDVDKTDVEIPTEVLGTDPPKQCIEIGQFCMFHGECCSNACLGYLKKCVSGSG